MELSVCTVGIIAFMSSGLMKEGAISADILKGFVWTPTHGKFSSSLDVRRFKSSASHLPPTCLIRADNVEDPNVGTSLIEVVTFPEKSPFKRFKSSTTN